VTTLLAVLCPATVAAQADAPAAAQTEAQGVRLEDPARLGAAAASDAEYRLGPGDLVEITVFGVQELTQTVRISASGWIKLPLLEPIQAADRTAAELEQQLTAALSRELVRNPQVSVFVKEYRAQPVFVLGAVRSPGQYQVTLRLGIIDVLTLAGGLQQTAGDEAVLQRLTPSGETERIRIDLRALLENGDLSLNYPVQGGDVIHVEERLSETVFIVGEVNRAGAFPLPERQELRVSQAIAWAGGPMRTAKLSEGMIVRYKENGEREELPVNFADILEGKREDIVVRNNDIIFIPGSKFKSFGLSLLGAIPYTVMQLPYRIP
jgi:polysaccharide export outer membrane protein